MVERFLFDGPEDAEVTILLAHGAGAPMDSTSMNAAARALAGADFRVARFEFGYMGRRRTTGERTPPPKAEKVIPEYLAAVEDERGNERRKHPGAVCDGEVYAANSPGFRV